MPLRDPQFSALHFQHTQRPSSPPHFSPTRRSILGAALGGAATLAIGDFARPASASALAVAPKPVWSVQTVAIIGADAIANCGNDVLRSDAKALGFRTGNVFVDAVAGRTLGGRDKTGRSMADILAGAIENFGGDPDVWIIDVATSGSDADIAQQVTDALDAMADNTDRKICWLNQAERGELDLSRQRFNAIAAPLVSARRQAWFQDLNDYLNTHDVTRIWDNGGTQLLSYGYALLRRFIQFMILPATTGQDTGWTKDQLVDVPPRPGSSVFDPESGWTWQTTRYEDLYRAGDTFQQTLERCSGGRVVTLPPGEFLLDDFSNGNHDAVRLGSGGATGCVGLAGSGRDTVIRLGGPEGRYTDSNTGNLLAVDLLGGAPAYFGNFQLQGVPMTASSNTGIFLANSHGSVCEWLYLNGASKGFANYPPGETFGLDIYRSDHVIVRDSEVDGRDASTRQRIAASPIGWDGSWSRYSQDATLRRTYVHHSLASMTTFWLTNGVTIDNFHSYSCGSGSGRLSGSQINLEEVTGPVRINYPRLYTHGQYYAQNQWSGDPTATTNSQFAFAQACTTSDQKDVVCVEPRFDLNINGLMATAAYGDYTATSGATQKIVTPPTVIKDGVRLSPHAHNTRGWQSAATVTNDFTWVR